MYRHKTDVEEHYIRKEVARHINKQRIYLPKVIEDIKKGLDWDESAVLIDHHYHQQALDDCIKATYCVRTLNQIMYANTVFLKRIRKHIEI